MRYKIGFPEQNLGALSEGEAEEDKRASVLITMVSRATGSVRTNFALGVELQLHVQCSLYLHVSIWEHAATDAAKDDADYSNSSNTLCWINIELKVYWADYLGATVKYYNMFLFIIFQE